MQFSDFDTAAFLRDYWQKKPLLIRNPWGQWRNPIDPDELAGLACEDGVESRLITQADHALALEEGPLPETRFGQLGGQPWTLLVQAVDHLVPDVAALIDPFRFVPNWRIDDVMVSYATDGGGVGAHFDQYDVFLVQGLGRRRWQVGGLCDSATVLAENDHLRLLADFVPTDEWVLEPGDILYVPPRIAHHGVAVGDDCMTYSIGFRAPSRAELVEHWSEALVDAMPDEDRYADPDLGLQANPGEISPAAIDRLHGLVTAALADRDAFARWFGTYSSTPKYPDTDWTPEEPMAAETVAALLAQGMPLVRNPASRFSFVRQGEGLLLFVDGDSFDCTGDAVAIAELVCAQDRIAVEPADAGVALLTALVNQGSIAFEEEA